MKEMEIIRKGEEIRRDDMTLRQPRETCLPNERTLSLKVDMPGNDTSRGSYRAVTG